MLGMDTNWPVITLDGPGGSGKGTISRLLAHELGWRFLDSGALYRLVTLAAQHHGIGLDNERALKTLAAHLDVEFEAQSEGREQRILLEGEEVTTTIRSERCGNDASRMAALPAVRAALLGRQRAFRLAPGLIADGRDMGRVVFPDAMVKIFLTASPEERAKRRHKQLKGKGMNVTVASLVEEIAERDERDSQRAASPMKPAHDAVMLDTSALSIDQVMDGIRVLCRERLDEEV